MIEYKKHEDTSYQLKPEGIQIARDGSHEARFWSSLPAAGSPPVSDQDLVKLLGNDVMQLGRNKALQLRWAKREGTGFVRIVSVATRRWLDDFTDWSKVNAIDDALQKDLMEVEATGSLKAGERRLKELSRRKLILPKCVLFRINAQLL